MDWPENKKSFREGKNPVDIFFMKWYIIPGWYSDRSCTKECFFIFYAGRIVSGLSETEGRIFHAVAAWRGGTV